MRVISATLAVAIPFLMSGCVSPNQTTGYSGAPKEAQPQPGLCISMRNVITASSATSVKGASKCPPGLLWVEPLSQKDIRARMDANNGAFQAIYHRSLRSDPTIAGAIAFNMKISPSGEVVALELDPQTAVPNEFAQKILARVRFIMFPVSSSSWEGKYTLSFYPASR